MTIALLLGLFLLTFAIPVRVWRTGELPAPPLPVVEGGPTVRMPTRIWIDTDAACGHGRTTDPDDCFGLLLLARSNAVEIVGISTVYGNATLDVTDRTTRDLVAMLYRDRGRAPAVYRGSATPIGEDGSLAPQPAHEALRRALKEGPLTLIGLGPLTNVAAALRGRPALRANVARLVAVMGRRRGHLFHPKDPKLRRWRWFYDLDALLVGVPREVPDEVRARSTGLYCPRVNAQLYPRLMDAL